MLQTLEDMGAEGSGTFAPLFLKGPAEIKEIKEILRFALLCAACAEGTFLYFLYFCGTYIILCGTIKKYSRVKVRVHKGILRSVPPRGGCSGGRWGSRAWPVPTCRRNASRNHPHHTGQWTLLDSRIIKLLMRTAYTHSTRRFLGKLLSILSTVHLQVGQGTVL